jgi:acetyl esterase/lipase
LYVCAKITAFGIFNGGVLMDAKTVDARIHEFDVEDVEYLRHGDKPLLARVFKPRGAGPFPALVDLHGGAWCASDRTAERVRHEVLAGHGYTVVVPDFRQGREGAYPKSVADINYGVRWVKLHAKELKTRADLVGISGQSSGGHLAMLVAMRPHDPRYDCIALPAGSPAVDATVRCVVMSWPVINPLARYRFAKREAARANPPSWPAGIIERHHQYWGSEQNMAEGNPMLALERSEKVATPPAIWFQGRGDILHDYKDEESNFLGTEAPRFVANYRKAGGEIELKYFDSDRKPGQAADLTKIGDTFEHMLAFVATHLKHAR